MGPGLFKIPALLSGTVACLLIEPRDARRFAKVMAVLFLAASLAHAIAQMSGERDHWFIFACGTIDLALLAVMAAVLDARPPTPRCRC
jgi:hypothetical protein